MHPCLQIPELMSIIFEMVLDDTLGGAKTLATLARTCSCFHNLALDILWRTLPTLAPLIKCLSEDKWAEKTDAVGRRVVELVGSLEDSDLSRFSSYAARVKVLRRYHSPATSLLRMRVHEDTFSKLYASRPFGSLLPNLREFEWRQSFKDPANDVAHLLVLLLNPKITNMSVYMTMDLGEHDSLVTQLEAALTYFAAHSPFLEHMTFICPLVPRLGTAISNVLLRHSGLRTVYTFQTPDTPMSAEALLHLSRLSTLEKLSVRTDNFTGIEGGMQSLLTHSDLVFPALQCLVIYSDTLANCNLLLDAVQSSQLEYLHILVLHPPIASEVQQFTSGLVRHPSNASLASINFTSGQGSPRHDSKYIISGANLKPLLSLKNIRECKIELRCPLALDNTFVKDLAMAWPQLCSLELGTEWRRDTGTPGVTLKGLIPLIQHCPFLTILGLPINTDVSEFSETYDETRPAEGYFSNRISALFVGPSKIDHLGDEAVMVAGFLSDLFPNLTYIDSLWGREESPLHIDEDDEDEAEFERWKKVQKLVREMGRIRKQERRWQSLQVRVQVDNQHTQQDM
ncbi:hypothetical protein AcV7_009823 [Taiwanofungus camphoratus]|nr:hypothetical protein AcW2_007318 [Antrodia cinnamomea]KAI0947382.1 hypothetical protein AcV7_009823 [Antrodia cinnamomea]